MKNKNKTLMDFTEKKKKKEEKTLTAVREK